MKMGKSLKVLLVEDNLIEIMKMKRTISLLKLKHTIHEAKNGEEALKFLEIRANIPDIILLDLNMPKINGIEFLRIIKANDELKHIPTIILTTSSNQKDLLECYRTGMSGYILKPLKYEDYIKKIEVVLSYWSVNELILA
jgi:CheY-like chemotaxis protein